MHKSVAEERGGLAHDVQLRHAVERPKRRARDLRAFRTSHVSWVIVGESWGQESTLTGFLRCGCSLLVIEVLVGHTLDLDNLHWH